jgi:hypothetical protein
LLAAIAVIVFTGHPQDGEMLPFCEETGRRKTPAGRLPIRSISSADADEAQSTAAECFKPEFQGFAATISENSC